MTEPTEGIVVSYAATQDSHSREQLDKVVEHALRHDGYAGGWYDGDSCLYYFDSNRLFPEDRLEDALRFGRENGQRSVYVLSTGASIAIDAGVCALRGVLQTALPTKAVGKRGNYLSPSEQKTLLPFSATSEQNQLCKTS